MPNAEQIEAINKARAFADRAHGVERERLSRQAKEQHGAARSMAAARGNVLSGGMVIETAKIEGKRITAVLHSRLELLFEGLDMHKAVLDDQLIPEIVKELGLLRTGLTAQLSKHCDDGLGYARAIENDSVLYHA